VYPPEAVAEIRALESALSTLQVSDHEKTEQLADSRDTIDSLRKQLEQSQRKLGSVHSELRRIQKERLLNCEEKKSRSCPQSPERDSSARLSHLESTNFSYWRKIQKQNRAISELDAKILEYEKRQLACAPVHVRRRPPPIHTEFDEQELMRALSVRLDPLEEPPEPAIRKRHYFRGLNETTDPDPIRVRIID
jgi:chromosome segregation ATPase